jgi:hypothetical protein
MNYLWMIVIFVCIECEGICEGEEYVEDDKEELFE